MKTRHVLELADVRLIADVCRTEARTLNLAVTLAIVDDGGHLLHLERLDARPSTVDVAIRKARSAALMRAPTARLAARVATNPEFLALDALPIVGGVPLLIHGECVGAIGVSGGTASDDEVIALAGCRAIGATAAF